MRTGLKKKQKETVFFFNEADPMAEIKTYNTDLKNRLTAYAEKYPELCRLTDDDGFGVLIFEIDKRRIGLRLTAPYSDERREKARENGKMNGIQTRKTNA